MSLLDVYLYATLLSLLMSWLAWERCFPFGPPRKDALLILEITNLSPRVEKLVNLTKLDQVFNKMKGFFGSK